MYDVGLVVATDELDKEFIVRLENGATGQAVYDALLPKLGVAVGGSTFVVERTGRAIGTDERLAGLELRWGDRLTLVAGSAAPSGVGPIWALRGVDGPSAGVVLDLSYGSHVVGRDPASADLVVTDPSISRPHARLEVSESMVAVSDLNSTNGTFIDGARVGEAATVAPGQRIAFGDSDFTLTTTSADQSGGLLAHIEWSQGTLRFNRQPRLPDPESTDPVVIPTPPSTPTKRKIPMISALAPLVGAGVILAAKGVPKQYAVMAILSPMIIVFNAMDDRRSGRKKFRQDAAAFREQLDRLGAQLSDRLREEQAWRERRWPRAADLITLVTKVDPRLWWRRPMDDDFLDVRVGRSDQTVRFHIEYVPGGDTELDKKAQDLVDGLRTVSSAPTVVGLREIGVLGLVGSREDVEAEARWVVAQITAEQSPRDVGLAVVAPDRAAAWDSLKWVPHARTLSETDVPMAFDDERASALWRGLIELVDRRVQVKNESFSASSTVLPHMVVVVEPPLQIPRHTVSELLEKASGSGVTVVWLANSRGELPGECDMVLEIPARGGAGSMWRTGAERTVQSVTPEGLDAPLLLTWLLELAPLRDITSQAGGGSVPRAVNLLSLLGLEEIDARSLAHRWASDDGALSCVVGHDGESVFSLDIERDGPHGLVAGMTGSGKSEFLQSLVASLACSYAPSRINFVLVDYKGGSAFRSCQFLPHTVGFFTDLDGHLAERAMVSLEAELAYREHVITAEGGAKDLAEFRRCSPASAPPSLLIVVDEFAFLKKEVPEFVDRLVDVAQRGRSLGVHLILATQRPGSVVSDDIRGNANLRVALRVASPEDSKEVIDRADAVAIGKDLPGRAYVKTGHGSVRAVQSAYVGGDSRALETTGTSLAKTFMGTGSEQRALAIAMRTGSEDVTDLDRIVVASQEAFATSGAAAMRKPWVEPLAGAISLASLDLVTESGSIAVSVGQADVPSKQRQEPYVIDLEATPNFIVYGGPGKGKTTFLRSLVVALASRLAPADLNLYAIDFGQNGLADLAGLPHWGGTAGQGDLARVHRLIDLLEELLAERREVLGASRTGSASEYRLTTGSPMAEIVVMVDNLSAVASLMNTMAEQVYLSRLFRLVADGRSAGLHFVITVDRPGAVPAALASAVSGSLVLSLSNPMDYATLGLARLSKFGDLTSGRAFDRSGTEIQIAVVGDPTAGTSGDQLRDAVRSLATSAGATDVVVPLRLLPTSVALSELTPSNSLRELVVGVDERYRPAAVNLDREPRFLVVGPSGSGRSTALRTVVSAIRSVEPLAPMFLFAPRRTPLTELGGWTSTSNTPETMLQVVGELRTAISARSGEGGHPIVVVIDDGDDLAESTSPLSGAFDQIQRAAADSGVIFLAAVTSFKAMRTYSSWIGPLRSAKNGLLLWADSQSADVFETRLPNAPSGDVPPGRAQLFSARGSRPIHIAQ